MVLLLQLADPAFPSRSFPSKLCFERYLHPSDIPLPTLLHPPVSSLPNHPFELEGCLEQLFRLGTRFPISDDKSRQYSDVGLGIVFEPVEPIFQIIF